MATSKWGRPPLEKSHQRYKIMFFGEAGTAKSILALQWPQAAYIDNHKSTTKYEPSFPQHRFANPKDADEHSNLITSLAKDPGDRLTLVVDDVTVYHEQIQQRWHDIFMVRRETSAGHHKDFYTFQPSDHRHIKSELKKNILTGINMDMNLILIARSANKYKSGSGGFMEVIGTTFGGDASLAYAPDYIFELLQNGNKRYCQVHKQRLNLMAGEKPFPETFEFTIDGFYKFFLEHVNQDLLMKEATPLPDEADEALIVEEKFEVKASQDTTTPTNSKPEPTTKPEQLPKHNGYITRDQLETCKRLKTELGFTNKEWFDQVEKEFPGTKSVKNFTYNQAKQFIGKLEAEPKNRPTQSQ